MIFVTVGAQMPFDRLIRAVDDWAQAGAATKIFAQIGVGAWQPQHIPYAEMLPPSEFERRVRECTLMVAHAGIGSIFAAMNARKPLLVMPRRASLRETRNEHQLATVKHFEPYGVAAAMDERELQQKLAHHETIPAPQALAPTASPRLLAALRAFVEAS